MFKKLAVNEFETIMINLNNKKIISYIYKIYNYIKNKTFNFKGIQCNLGILDEKNYLSEMFDIITSFEVIEYVNNPKSELKISMKY
jgi:hypothetical protein